MVLNEWTLYQIASFTLIRFIFAGHQLESIVGLLLKKFVNIEFFDFELQNWKGSTHFLLSTFYGSVAKCQHSMADSIFWRKM